MMMMITEWDLPVRTEGSYENIQSGCLVSRPRFDRMIFQIWSKRVTHLSVIFSVSYCILSNAVNSFHCLTVAEAVECYICSWNPSDYKNGGGGSNNQHDYTDVCSAGHFDPERVRTHDCNRGCEIVSMRNPNGMLSCSAHIYAPWQRT